MDRWTSSTSGRWRRPMPRADEPRIPVRFSRSDYDLLANIAAHANVSLGGLIRECAVRHAAEVARDVGRGTTTIRRQRAVQAVRGQVAPASSLVVESDAVK